MNTNTELMITGLRYYRILEISQVLSQAAVLQGLNVKTAEFTHEPLMTTEVAHVRLGKEKIYSPLIRKGGVDIFVCFEPVIAVEFALEYLSRDGVLIMNENPIISSTQFSTDEISSLFEDLAEKTIKLDVFQKAKEAGDIRKNNFVMLGVLDGLKAIPVTSSNIAKAVEMTLAPEDVSSCFKALEVGRRAVLP